MKLSNRARSASLAILLLSVFLLATVRGPWLTDGVAYYAPIMLGAFIAWRWKVFGRERPRSYTFLAGVIGGLVATLVWPTGVLAVLWVTGKVAMQDLPMVVVFASFFRASCVGGVMALIRSWGYDPREKPAMETTVSSGSDLCDIPVQVIP